MRSGPLVTSFFTLAALSTVPASAATLYLNIPSIPGTADLPGYPTAISIESLSGGAPYFAMTKLVDATTSPALASAVGAGTHLGTTPVLLYNSSTPTGAPDAILPLQNTVASSLATSVGFPSTETLTLFATNPQQIYLELPGITGPASTPGYPGVMAVQSFSIAGNTLTITKAVDSASAAIHTAVIQGKPLFDASLLFYDTTTPTGPPDTIVSFTDSLATSYQLSPSDVETEQDIFNFINVTQPVPEPTMIAMSCAALLTTTRRRRLR